MQNSVQLRKCSARVHFNYGIEGVRWHDAYDNGVTVYTAFVFDDNAPAHNVIALESYNSIVAAYDQSVHALYLFPRWDYSITTQSHVRKFAADYCGVELTSAEIRKGETIAIEADGFYMARGDMRKF